ncbi:MAG TPA: hypothetical protein VIP46_20825 [Pyrinomonadaceae bacterium]
MPRRDSRVGKRTTPGRGVRELAGLISAVLRHPDCPVSLYNDLLDHLCGYTADVTSPAHVAGWLEQQRSEQARAAAGAKKRRAVKGKG